MAAIWNHLLQVSDIVNSIVSPVWCAGGMFLISSPKPISTYSSSLLRVFHGEPRAVLLLSAEIIHAIPLVWIWVVFAIALAKQPEHRSWMLGGALGGFLTAVALFIGLLSKMEVKDYIGMATTLSYMGLMLGCYLSPLLGQKPIPKECEPKTDIPTREDAAKPSTSDTSGTDGFSSDNYFGTKHSDANFKASICTLFMVWTAAANCGHIERATLFYLQAPENRGWAMTVFQTLTPLGGLLFYAFFAVCALCHAENRLWQWSCGILLGSASLIILRLTTSDYSWQSWAVDGGLALLNLNVGIVCGFFTQDGPLPKRLSREIFKH